MCGIVYSKSFTGKGVVPTIVERYKAQRTRGYNGFGFFVPGKNRLTHNVKESRILSLVKREKEADEILFHHRFPTSTANVRNACHPFSTKDVFENNYVLVHNGVLRNEYELKRKHEEVGIEYVSKQENGRFNDSEALAYDVAMYLEGLKDDISAEGSIAFIAIKRDKAGKPVTLFFARNSGNPLKMKRTKYSLTLSSEGEGELIEMNTLYAMSYDTLEITKRPCTIGTGWSAYSGQSRTTPTGTNYHIPYSDFDDEDDELSGLGFPSSGAGDDDDSEYDSAYASEVKDAKESFLYEANYDTAVALGLAREALSKYQGRLLQLDMKSQDEEYELEAQEINEYCSLDDRCRFIEDAIKQLEKELTEEVVKEEVVKRPMGFHAHDFPTPPATPKGLPAGNTNTDKGDTR